MEVNRLRLKLDMVYRDLPLDEAEKRFAELAPPEAAAAPPAEEPAVVVKPKRKVVKALIPKTT
jgi:hypothetical protein